MRWIISTAEQVFDLQRMPVVLCSRFCLGALPPTLCRGNIMQLRALRAADCVNPLSI